MGWATRKIVPLSCAHLDFAAVEAGLVKTRGNVTATAKALGVPPKDLRRLVWSTELTDSVFEAVETALDEAQAIVFEALSSDDQAHRLAGAKAILRTAAGKRRGFGLGPRRGDEADPQPVAMKWLEPH
jgi:hypothetical protein